MNPRKSGLCAAVALLALLACIALSFSVGKRPWMEEETAPRRIDD